MKLNTGIIEVFHVLENASSVLTKLHDISHIVGRRKDACLYHRLFCCLNESRVRVVGRVVDVLHFAVCESYLVDNGRSSCDEVEVVLTFKAFLYYLHVEKSEKSAAEAESESDRSLRLERERSIVEL